MTDAEIKKQLDKAARIFNKVAAAIKQRYPHGYIYVEAEGKFHAMKDEGTQADCEIVKSISCNFDCGAW